MESTISLHPGLLSRAWLNLKPIADMSLEYEKTLLLEEHDDGVWLVAMAPAAMGACWISFEVGDEDVPSFRDRPITDPVLIGDADGSITLKMKELWKQYKKAHVEADLSEYVNIGPGVSTGPAAIPGLERVNVRFRTLDWHQDTVEVQKPCPDWRGSFATMDEAPRLSIAIPMEVMKALLQIEGCRPPSFVFDSGTHALATFEPAEGVRPVTFVKLAIGKRDEDADEPTEPTSSFVAQTFDTSTNTYRDDEPVEGDNDVDFAGRAAQGALASLLS